MRIPEFALRRPVTVLMVTIAVLVLGIVSLPRIKLDFLPQMDLPFVGVHVPIRNGIPSQVEKDIARPIEEVMATIGGLQRLESYSDASGTFVQMMFQLDQSIDVVRMDVQEKMEQVRPLLPSDVEDYFIFTFNSADIPIMVGRISATGRDLAEEYDLLERRVINPLSRIEGVGQVKVDGVGPKSITIYLILDKILEHSVDVDKLFQVLLANNTDASLGKAHMGGQRISVRTLGQFRSIDDIRNMQVTAAGITIADVAEVVYSEPVPEYYRRLNTEPAVAFEIRKASGANIVEVSRQVHEVLEEIGRDPALSGVDVVLFFDQAQQITSSLRELLKSGFLGSIFAVGVLFLFLRRLSATLIVAIAIPFSVIATLIFIYLSNRTLNMLTMMGLMLAVGMLVDNAIVVLESIFRRREQGESSVDSARHGAMEVAMAVTASTLTSVIVFAPIILTGGNRMAFFLSEVGITISVTLVLSLAVCLTLVPLLSARTKVTSSKEEYKFLQRFRNGYVRVLRWTAVEHPMRTGLLFVPVTILLTIAAVKISGFGSSDMDEEGVKQDNLYVRLDFTDNTNIYGVVDYVDEIEGSLMAVKDSLGIESVYTFFTDNFAAFGLFFEEPESWGNKDIKELRQYLRDNLPPIAGAEYRFGNDRGGGRGARSISVTLFGEDSPTLEEISEEVVRRFALIDGMEDVRSEVQEGADEVRVALDREQASRYNIQANTLAQILNLTFRGVSLGHFQGETREVDFGIVLEPSDRRNIENMEQIPITYRDDRPVLLGQVSNFTIGKGPQRIFRQSQKSALNVRSSYEGEDHSGINGQVAQIMNAIEMPPGYSWSFGRELEEQREQRNDMAMNTLLAIACVYFVMAALFESFLHPLVIMLCIPFAAIGVIWTLMLTSTPFNLMAMIGIVILIGIVVNNGIVLLDHINLRRKEGLGRSDAIIEGCRERFRPILMTASTTILGLIPLALGKAAAGDGYYYPLARAVMGGLAASTILTLVVLPTFYVLAERAVARGKRTLQWAKGRAPLPWATKSTADTAPDTTGPSGTS